MRARRAGNRPMSPTTREQLGRIEDMRKSAALIRAAQNVLYLWDLEGSDDAQPHPLWQARMVALREAVNAWDA